MVDPEQTERDDGLDEMVALGGGWMGWTDFSFFPLSFVSVISLEHITKEGLDGKHWGIHSELVASGRGGEAAQVV